MPINETSFQYRLRFFHKCRSPGCCDQGLDRRQVRGSALESTCGAPVLVVLVRYKHDPDSGLSRECQRVRLAPTSPSFAIKAVVVPARQVLDYMDQPLLQQPLLTDSQGRNVLGGPDVDHEGSICVTPLEKNGIAHLDNFSLLRPWDSAASCSTDQKGKQGCTPKDITMKGSSVGADELCLLVQLLKRSSQRPGAFDAYNMPHLVSRPFVVVTRGSLGKSQALNVAPNAALGQQDVPQLQQRQHTLFQQNQQGWRCGPGRQPMCIGSVVTYGASAAQFHSYGGDVEMREGGGRSVAAVSEPELRGCSHSTGSPNAATSQPGPCSSRRSCLSEHSSHDGGAKPPAQGAAAAGPSRAQSGAPTAGLGAAGVPLAPAVLGATAAVEASASGALAASLSSQAKFLLDKGGAPQEGIKLGLQHAPSATLLDLHSTGFQDLFEDLDARPLLAEDLMDFEGPVKRAKSNMTTVDVAAFLSDNSSGSLLSVSQRNSLILSQQDPRSLGGSKGAINSKGFQHLASSSWSANSFVEHSSF